MIYMGVDYGERRIGLAISDDIAKIGSPLETIDRRRIEMAAGLSPDDGLCKYIAEIARLNKVVHIVVGLPLSLTGDDSILTLKARKFATRLNQHTTAAVTLYDERYSSKTAMQSLQAIGSNTKKMRGRVDEIAAAVMLQSFLDSINSKSADQHDDLSQ